MKKLFFILLFLPFCLSAQTTETTLSDTTGHKLMMTFTDQDSLQDSVPQRTSYMSFFGKNKTEYSICMIRHFVFFAPKEEPMDIGPCTTKKYIFNEKEQIFNGKSYKYEIGLHKDSLFKFERDILLREDTVLGRLYRYYPELDTEVVLCDMSLQQGDTFRIPLIHIPSDNFPFDYYYKEQGLPIMVDTVLYISGIKHIVFHYITSTWTMNSIFYDIESGICIRNKIPFCFIEGIGPSYGLGYIMDLERYEQYLPLMLCLHKDDTLAFTQHEATGCELNRYTPFQIKEPKRATLTLQPNPAQDYILLRNEDASDLGGEIIITDAIGRVLLHRTMENAEMRINTSRYSSGTYFVRYRSKNGVQILKFVKAE